MRLSDVKNLIRFNTLMGMFICPSNRANVVAFIHGYEFGTGGECHFTKTLTEVLLKQYRIKPDSLGWPYQIERLAGRHALDWMEAYLLISSEILTAGLNRRATKAAKPGKK